MKTGWPSFTVFISVLLSLSLFEGSYLPPNTNSLCHACVTIWSRNSKTPSVPGGDARSRFCQNLAGRPSLVFKGNSFVLRRFSSRIAHLERFREISLDKFELLPSHHNLEIFFDDTLFLQGGNKRRGDTFLSLVIFQEK